ncbi:MAG TPA: SDR family oxidoreductase [Gaiellaceae bacterium]|jgi:NAD(P)-dependent dehydrogenase (short-subunit alcohol dehydrogenase family)
MSGRLAGKRCLVTGGGSGVGRAVARRYAEEGGLVVVSGRRAERLDETAAGLESITTCPGDVCVESDVERMVDAVVERHGGLDVVFHAAGVLRRNEQLEETDIETWQRDVAINLTGAYLVSRLTIPYLRESHGTLILVASQLAHISSRGYATYSATKHGVLGLVRSLALDLGPEGVRVNALSPGVTETDMAYIGRDFAAMRDQVAQTIPLRRVGRPEDMAGPALFLASEDSAWVTGQSLIVDGGFTTQ